MNSLLKLLSLVLLMTFGTANSQLTVHKLLTAGYVYQKQSFGELGGKLYILSHDDLIFRTGASAVLGETHGKFVAMPKAEAGVMLNFQRNVDFYHAWYFVLNAETTNEYFAPKAGFTIAGILDILGGYAFPYSGKTLEGKSLKGFGMNVSLNLPIPFLHDMLK